MFDLQNALPEMVHLSDAAPPDLVAAEDLVDELSSLFVARDRQDARIVRLIREAGETGAFRRDGYSSLSAMLRHRMSVHPGEALRLVTRANGLAATPLVAGAYEQGRLSGSQVDVLLEAAFTASEPFASSEAELVEMAIATPLIRELRKRLDYWLDAVAADDLTAGRNLVRELRALNVRRDGEMIRVSGWFDIESGEHLRATLEPGPPGEGDDRSTPARRADQLLDILNGGSGRPDILVHVSAEALTGRTPGISETREETSSVVEPVRISETGHGTFLTGDEIKRLSCDANLTRVIFDTASQPLDVGRTRRLITRAIRAAVCARDMGCVFPNCDRPSHWCDAHHIHHWVDGGETSIDNLVLLCRYHHVLVHEGGWTLTGTPGDLVFLRPDGTRLDNRPPPRHRTIPPPRRVPPPPLEVDWFTLTKELSASKLLHGP
ncbi:MAG: DUF222 domain-containing protein [Acidimicrobiia bacterium]